MNKEIMENLERVYDIGCYQGSKDFILDNIRDAALYELLAEECIELAHVALKKARILRRDIPTTVTHVEADSNISEEFNDVLLCAELLSLKRDPAQQLLKISRMVHKVEARYGEI